MIEDDAYFKQVTNDLRNDIFERLSRDPRPLSEMKREDITRELTEAIRKQFDLHGLHDDSNLPVIKTQLLWDTMTKRQKVQWWFFKYFLKDIGKSIRWAIDQANIALYEAEKDSDNYSSRIEYPVIFNQMPKGTILFDVKAKLAGSIEMVNINVEV